LTLVERVSIEVFKALVSVGKSLLASLIAVSASLCGFASFSH